MTPNFRPDIMPKKPGASLTLNNIPYKLKQIHFKERQPSARPPDHHLNTTCTGCVVASPSGAWHCLRRESTGPPEVPQPSKKQFITPLYFTELLVMP